MTVPIKEPPYATGTTNLQVGPGGGLGLACRPGDGIVLAGGWEIYSMYRISVNYLLGSVGFEARAPWDAGSRVLLHVDAGFGMSRGRGSVALVLPPEGRGARLDSSGFSWGGGVRVGIPIDERWAWIVDAAVRTVYLPTRSFPDLLDGGRAGVVTLPLTVGVQVRP